MLSLPGLGGNDTNKAVPHHNSYNARHITRAVGVHFSGGRAGILPAIPQELVGAQHDTVQKLCGTGRGKVFPARCD